MAKWKTFLANTDWMKIQKEKKTINANNTTKPSHAHLPLSRTTHKTPYDTYSNRSRHNFILNHYDHFYPWLFPELNTKTAIHITDHMNTEPLAHINIKGAIDLDAAKYLAYQNHSHGEWKLNPSLDAIQELQTLRGLRNKSYRLESKQRRGYFRVEAYE